MASIKISGLTEQTTASDTDLLPVASSAGMAKRMTLANFVKWLSSKFAPAGYGLGEKATTYYPTSEEELNTMLTECVGKMPDRSFGVFTFSDNIGSVWGGGTMHATVFKTENAYAVATFYGYDYPNNRQFIKNLYGENWQPISWVNPPMALGVEYRTTERWNGKPVYAKAHDIGALPNNSTITIDGVLINGCKEVMDLHLRRIYGGLSVFPSYDGTYCWLTITSTTDLSQYSEVLTLKYTKD